MSTKPKSWSQVQNNNKISVSNPKFPCGACTFGVGVKSILCTSCDLWVHKKCSAKTDRLTGNRNFVCRKCSGEIVPAATASLTRLTSGMTNFKSNPLSNILLIRLANVVVVLTQSLHVLPHRGKHSENCNKTLRECLHVCTKSAFGW